MPRKLISRGCMIFNCDRRHGNYCCYDCGYHYTLYDGKNSPPLRLYAVQGEAGSRTFVLEIVGQDGKSPVGLNSQAYAYVQKNDGNLVLINCQVCPAASGVLQAEPVSHSGGLFLRGDDRIPGV